jgi:hypothetical protein
MSVTKNENYWANPDHQETPDAPPRAALSGGECTVHTSDSDHLRWSPNFNTNTITTCTTFFITGTKSKDGRKWPEITPKADRIRREVCRRISAVRQRMGAGLVALGSCLPGLQNPVRFPIYSGRNRRRWRWTPIFAISGVFSRKFSSYTQNRSIKPT